MDSNGELHDQKFIKKQNPSKDVLIEDLRCIDFEVNSEEKSTDFKNPSFFQSTFSHGTFAHLTIKDGKLGTSGQDTNVVLSRSVIPVIIAIVIAIFLVPIIIYYVFKSDPLPELNSVLGVLDVNISMVSCTLYSGMWSYSDY